MGIANLADALLNRRLYKQIGHCDDRAIASPLYEKYGAGTQESRQASRAIAGVNCQIRRA